jgi:hypothetical protein
MDEPDAPQPDEPDAPQPDEPDALQPLDITPEEAPHGGVQS